MPALLFSFMIGGFIYQHDINIKRKELVLSQQEVHHLTRTSEREPSALRMAIDGATTEQIAENSHLSAGTVRNYLGSASSKLNAKNRIEADRIAHQNGWL